MPKMLKRLLLPRPADAYRRDQKLDKGNYYSRLLTSRAGEIYSADGDQTLPGNNKEERDGDSYAKNEGVRPWKRIHSKPAAHFSGSLSFSSDVSDKSLGIGPTCLAIRLSDVNKPGMWHGHGLTERDEEINGFGIFPLKNPWERRRRRFPY